jgi:hypothetical protein
MTSTFSCGYPITSENVILARVLGNGDERLPPTIARYFLKLGFNDRDKARMHDLAVRNQGDALSPAEKEELSPTPGSVRCSRSSNPRPGVP